MRLSSPPAPVYGLSGTYDLVVLLNGVTVTAPLPVTVAGHETDKDITINTPLVMGKVICFRDSFTVAGLNLTLRQGMTVTLRPPPPTPTETMRSPASPAPTGIQSGCSARPAAQCSQQRALLPEPMSRTQNLPVDAEIISVHGTFTDVQGTPIAALTVSLSIGGTPDITAVAGANGIYVFLNIAASTSYVVKYTYESQTYTEFILNDSPVTQGKYPNQRVTVDSYPAVRKAFGKSRGLFLCTRGSTGKRPERRT